jgi:predicted neutral ceramidase superfamily lipid hydrolase
MKPIRIITTVFLILLPSLALAEVSDKVPTISQLWSQGFIIGLIAFMGSIYRIWTGVISGLLALFFSFYISQILTDPFVGSAIINEQGTSYIIAVWGSIVLMIFLLTIGFVINLRKRKTT